MLVKAPRSSTPLLFFAPAPKKSAFGTSFSSSSFWIFQSLSKSMPQDGKESVEGGEWRRKRRRKDALLLLLLSVRKTGSGSDQKGEEEKCVRFSSSVRPWTLSPPPPFSPFGVCRHGCFSSCPLPLFRTAFFLFFFSPHDPLSWGSPSPLLVCPKLFAEARLRTGQRRKMPRSPQYVHTSPFSLPQPVLVPTGFFVLM